MRPESGFDDLFHPSSTTIPVLGFQHPGDCYIGQGGDEPVGGSTLEKAREEAAKARTAWEKNPDNKQLKTSYTNTLSGLLGELFRAEHWQELLDNARTLFELDPSDRNKERLSMSLISYFIKVVQPSENFILGVKLLREANQLHPATMQEQKGFEALVGCLGMVAMHEIDTGRIEEAKAHLDEAIALNICDDEMRSNHADALTRLAMAQFQASQIEAAIESLEKAVSLRPTDQEIIENLVASMGVILIDRIQKSHKDQNLEWPENFLSLLRNMSKLFPDEEIVAVPSMCLILVGQLHDEKQSLWAGRILFLGLDLLPQDHPFRAELQDHLCPIFSSLSDEELRGMNVRKTTSHLTEILTRRPDNEAARLLRERLLRFLN